MKYMIATNSHLGVGVALLLRADMFDRAMGLVLVAIWVAARAWRNT